MYNNKYTYIYIVGGVMKSVQDKPTQRVCVCVSVCKHSLISNTYNDNDNNIIINIDLTTNHDIIAS